MGMGEGKRRAHDEYFDFLKREWMSITAEGSDTRDVSIVLLKAILSGGEH